MEAALPLLVAIPLGLAPLLGPAHPHLPRRVIDLASIAGCASVTLLAVFLLARGEVIVHFFGGWEPVDGLVLGIPFVGDPLALGFVALAGTVTTAGLVFTWRYFETVGTLYHMLTLVFLGGLNGFVLSGDLFNMFIFLKVMSLAAYALTAHKVEEEAPLQAGLNFAVTNTIGALLFLVGAALIYAETGTFNLAQAGRALTGLEPPVVLAFGLMVSGLFVKAAIVPFHLWQADSHAVAPAPVCMLFAGVMIQAGLYGIVRVYWVVFETALDDIGALRAIFLAFALLTTLIGAVMSFLQTHLKRLLSFSSVAHVGIAATGIALFTSDGLTGTILYVSAHGVVKGSLFLAVGIVLHRYGSFDEPSLRGRARDRPVLVAALLFGGLILGGAPPFGLYGGKTMLEDASAAVGLPWVGWVAVGAGALTGAAMLRAALHIGTGWGRPHRQPGARAEQVDEHERYTHGNPRVVPLSMWIPVWVLLIAGAALPHLPGLTSGMAGAADQATASEDYRTAVIEQRISSYPAGSEPFTLKLEDVLKSTVALMGAAALAFAGLRYRPKGKNRPARALEAVATKLRALHSGHVGDYVAWLTFGTMIVCTSFVVMLR